MTIISELRTLFLLAKNSVTPIFLFLNKFFLLIEQLIIPFIFFLIQRLWPNNKHFFTYAELFEGSTEKAFLNFKGISKIFREPSNFSISLRFLIFLIFFDF